jgi:hypothetical protein
LNSTNTTTTGEAKSLPKEDSENEVKKLCKSEKEETSMLTVEEIKNENGSTTNGAYASYDEDDFFIHADSKSLEDINGSSGAETQQSNIYKQDKHQTSQSVSNSSSSELSPIKRTEKSVSTVNAKGPIVRVRGILSTIGHQAGSDEESDQEKFDIEAYYCKICLIIINDEKNLKQHAGTQMHKAKLQISMKANVNSNGENTDSLANNNRTPSQRAKRLKS